MGIKRDRAMLIFFIFSLLTFSLQSCLGLGGNNDTTSNFTHTNTGTNGQQIGVSNNIVFNGKIYFTQGRSLFVLDKTRTPHRLTTGIDVRDPAVSPDGKWVAFDIHYKNYSDLAYISTQGGPVHTIRSGQGKYYKDPLDPTIIHNSYVWYEQPIWSADKNNPELLFLSDLQKNFDWYFLGNPFNSAAFLDLQVFSLPFNSDPATKPQAVAYASYGDGGDRDPSFRPGHPNQIAYTHYAYDKTGTQQVIQIFLEDATAIPNHPRLYSPLKDAGIALTSANEENIQPAFSPEGNSLAYVRREGNGQMGLYVMPLPTNDVTTTPNDPASEQIALAPYKKSSLILTQQFLGQPVWSPDGTQIAFVSYTNEEYDIWLINVKVDAKTGTYSMKGTPLQLISGGVDADSRPHWTQ